MGVVIYTQYNSRNEILQVDGVASPQSETALKYKLKHFTKSYLSDENISNISYISNNVFARYLDYVTLHNQVCCHLLSQKQRRFNSSLEKEMKLAPRNMTIMFINLDEHPSIITQNDLYLPQEAGISSYIDIGKAITRKLGKLIKSCKTLQKYREKLLEYFLRHFSTSPFRLQLPIRPYCHLYVVYEKYTALPKCHNFPSS